MNTVGMFCGEAKGSGGMDLCGRTFALPIKLGFWLFASNDGRSDSTDKPGTIGVLASDTKPSKKYGTPPKLFGTNRGFVGTSWLWHRFKHKPTSTMTNENCKQNNEWFMHNFRLNNSRSFRTVFITKDLTLTVLNAGI